MLAHLTLPSATAWGRLLVCFIPESHHGPMAFGSPLKHGRALLTNPSSSAQGPAAGGASQQEFLSGSPGGFGSLVSVQTIIMRALFKHAHVCRAVRRGVGCSRRRGGGSRQGADVWVFPLYPLLVTGDGSQKEKLPQSSPTA